MLNKINSFTYSYGRGYKISKLFMAITLNHRTYRLNKVISISLSNGDDDWTASNENTIYLLNINRERIIHNMESLK